MGIRDSKNSPPPTGRRSRNEFLPRTGKRSIYQSNQPKTVVELQRTIVRKRGSQISSTTFFIMTILIFIGYLSMLMLNETLEHSIILSLWCIPILIRQLSLGLNAGAWVFRVEFVLGIIVVVLMSLLVLFEFIYRIFLCLGYCSTSSILINTILIIFNLITIMFYSFYLYTIWGIIQNYRQLENDYGIYRLDKYIEGNVKTVSKVGRSKKNIRGLNKN